MDVRRLHLLLELSRLGSMREVADELGTTTSTVSQQIAALAREAGTPLVEPDGRRVRLTPAGRRLAEHAVTILAAVDAARLDLDPDAEPVGTLRVAGFATAIRRSLLPVVAELKRDHPRVEVLIHEYEPLEAFDLLGPRRRRPRAHLRLQPGARAARAATSRRAALVGRLGPRRPGRRARARAASPSYAERDWIVNSRNTADEDVVRTLGLPGRLHAADRAPDRQPRPRRGPDRGGHGFGLLPRGRASRRGIRVLPLTDPRLMLRAYAVDPARPRPLAASAAGARQAHRALRAPTSRRTRRRRRPRRRAAWPG